MKRYFLVCGALFLFTSLASADPDSPTGVSAGSGRGVRGWHGVKIKPTDPKNGASSVIKGVCTIEKNDANPLGGPCVSVVLVLNQLDGTEAAKARTTNQGKFSFESRAGVDYQILPNSKLYKLVSPLGKIQAGDSRVEVKIEQL